MTCRISIVVPCFNGEAYLEASLARLEEFLRSREPEIGASEILFVDDGSSDRTPEIVASRFPGMKLLRHPVNRGKGAAVRTGVMEATGSFVFFIDADVPYELSALLPMLDYLDRKEFHVAIGSRSRLPDAHLAKRTRTRRIASFVFTELVSRIVVTGVRDTQCGFKGFQRQAARYLFSQMRAENFAFDVEVLYLAFKNDLDVKKVPVQLCGDEASSISVLRHGPPMLFEVVRLPVRYHRGRYERLEDWEDPTCPA